MTTALEIVVAALLVTGAAFALVGSFALARLSDFFRRLHGPSKATTLGVGCVLAASMLWFALHGQAAWHEPLIALFLFFTAPVSAYMLVQAALAQGTPDPDPPSPDDAPPAD